jgi:regulator of CtrA degradation
MSKPQDNDAFPGAAVNPVAQQVGLLERAFATKLS